MTTTTVACIVADEIFDSAVFVPIIQSLDMFA